MANVEIITNALTGVQEVRALTPAQEAALQAVRNSLPVPDISFSQLLIGLVGAGWITEAEGNGWLAGTLPPPVLALINALPENQRFAARARALRPSVVVRSDPLVNALAAAQGKTAAEMDAFFRTASTF